MICSPARSFTLPPGLNRSNFAWISTPPGSSDLSLTKGVLPTAPARESKTTHDFQRSPGAVEGFALRRDLRARLAVQLQPRAKRAQLRLPGGLVDDEPTHPARRQIPRGPARRAGRAADADGRGQQLLLIEPVEKEMARIPVLLLGTQHPPAMAGTMVSLSPSASDVASPRPWRMSSSLRNRFT